MSNTPSLVTGLFEGHVRKSPESVALVLAAAGGNTPLQTITYGELDGRANAVARRLRQEGVRAGDRVALMMERSADLIAGMLAVLKVGAAYVPLDPSCPRHRQQYVISDTGARVCLTHSPLAHRAQDLCPELVIVDRVAEMGEPAELAPAIPADAPAYVMYTSGSTGRPKGVVVPHRAIVRLVKGQSFARLDETRVLLHMAPASFDASTFEIWGALLNGARCVVAPEWGIPEPARLRAVIGDTGVTTMWLTASLFNSIIDHAPDALATVSEVLTGGEALSVPHVRKAQDALPAVQLINGYGPTEGTTFSCCFRIPRPVPPTWRSIPIGAPIAGTSARILDTQLGDVPGGETGELYIGGDGLALEYLNLPELTADRFIRDKLGNRLYRTGDNARWLGEGTIEFLGREDDQVKIRGYRVELGEIEATLREVPDVADAVVALRDDVPGDNRLAAYYTASSRAATPSHQRMRELLESRLPSYMVPSAFVRLDAIPLTANGKADRRALPPLSRQRPLLSRPAVGPRTPLERWIASMWRDVLQLDELGVDDRFFDLGGTSISALRFLALLNAETSVPVPALLLFRAPTVAQLAAILQREYPTALPRHLIAEVAEPTVARPMVLAEYRARRQDALEERRRRRRAP